MREYLLVWRALPKLLVGGLFLLEVSTWIVGERTSMSLSVVALHKLSTYFSGATLLLAIVLTAAVAASLGLFLLQVASATARTLGRLGLRLVPEKRRSGRWPLRDLFENPYAIGLRRFKEKSEFYSKFYELKSSSFSAENLGKTSEIRTHFSAVSMHLLSSNYEDVEAINYYGMLGQDRRTLEIIEDEIQSLENFVVVLLLLPTMLPSLRVAGASLAASVAACGCLSLFVIPEIVYRKEFLARIVLTAYMDNFTVHEGAEVADREGEAYF